MPAAFGARLVAFGARLRQSAVPAALLVSSNMPVASSDKDHLSILICGHVDNGRRTTTARLIFELGGLPERELDKLKQEAERLGKGSFAFAFYMDRHKEEHVQGATISCATKEFFTEKWYYTIIAAPSHRNFIKNMITCASQADVSLIMVPADGSFTIAIAKGKGMDVEVSKDMLHVHTMYAVLDKMCRVPDQPVNAPMRMPISRIYKIKGVADVLAGHVEQGIVKPGKKVLFLPTHTACNPCVGKVFTVEMHHTHVDFANPGDDVALNIMGLDKNNMPKSGDVMMYKKNTTLGNRASLMRISSSENSQRDQGRLLANRLCAVWSFCLLHLKAEVEGSKGNGCEEH